MGFWTLPKVDGLRPRPRGGHACITIGTSVVFFGGADRYPNVFDDVWVLTTENGYQWRHVETTSTPGCHVQPRSGASLTAVQDRIMLFGGHDPTTGACFNDVKVLDTNTWCWSSIPVSGVLPPPRHSHAAGLMANHCLLVYGGAGYEGPMSDVWVFSLLTATWERLIVQGEQPPAREMHAGCMVGQSSMMVYGGRSAEGRVLCDAAVFNVLSRSWTSAEPTPFSRCAHSCTFVGEPGTSSAAVLVYGGFSGEAVEGDVIQIGVPSFEVELCRRGPRGSDPSGSVPVARFAHTAAVVPSSTAQDGQILIIFGGVNPGDDLNDVAVWERGEPPPNHVANMQDLSSPVTMMDATPCTVQQFLEENTLL